MTREEKMLKSLSRYICNERTDSEETCKLSRKLMRGKTAQYAVSQTLNNFTPQALVHYLGHLMIESYRMGEKAAQEGKQIQELERMMKL